MKRLNPSTFPALLMLPALCLVRGNDQRLAAAVPNRLRDFCHVNVWVATR